MRTLLPPAPGAGSDREARVRALCREIAAGQAAAGRGRARALEDRGMELLWRDPALKAALFRLVDVAPACPGPRDVAAHLASLLGEVERPLAPSAGGTGAAPPAAGAARVARRALPPPVHRATRGDRGHDAPRAGGVSGRARRPGHRERWSREQS